MGVPPIRFGEGNQRKPASEPQIIHPTINESEGKPQMVHRTINESEANSGIVHPTIKKSEEKTRGQKNSNESKRELTDLTAQSKMTRKSTQRRELEIGLVTQCRIKALEKPLME